jgi:hypothetical protein
LPHPAACALRFSRPLDAFHIHREPAGLVSCRIRSWGCALQSFTPTAWPYAVSGADPLLALVPSRFHLDVPLPLAPAEAETSSDPDGSHPSSAGRSRCLPSSHRPSRRYRSTAEPNGRPTLGSRSSFEPNNGSALWDRSPFEPNGHPTLGSQSSLLPSCAHPREPEGSLGPNVRPSLRDRSPVESSVRSSSPVPRHRRTERPLDPPTPKRRRTRRSARRTPARRPAHTGHRSALREPEGSFRPDRSLACPKPEDSGWFERFHPHPVAAEAPSRIRRPQLDLREAETPYEPNEPSDPRRARRRAPFRSTPPFALRPEGRFASGVRSVPLHRNLRNDAAGRRSPLGDRSPFDCSRGPKSLRIELLRSAFAEPKPRCVRTSGRDGPRASSPSGV